MTVLDWKQSLASSEPPTGSSPLVVALWWDARGDWERAHTIAQELETREAAWVHAYLHRQEGDLGNAAYWYRRAGRPAAHGPLADEREEIAAALLASPTL